MFWGGIIPYYGFEHDLDLVTNYVTSSFAKINVYAETMTVHSISESAKYDVSDALLQCTAHLTGNSLRKSWFLLYDIAQFSQVLGALGGALGLYTGFCWITAFEIIELLVLMGLAAWGYKIATGKADEPQDQNVGRAWEEKQSSSLFAITKRGGSKTKMQQQFFN